MKQSTKIDKDNMMQPVEALTRFTATTEITDIHDAKVDEKLRYGFQIGDMGFLLPTDTKTEVVDFISTCPIPNTPFWYKGVINVRGNLISVIDLGILLSIDVDKMPRWILIIGEGSKATGISIDILPVTIDINKEVKELPPLSEFLQKHCQAACSYKKNIWLDLDYESLFIDLFSGLQN